MSKENYNFIHTSETIQKHLGNTGNSAKEDSSTGNLSVDQKSAMANLEAIEKTILESKNRDESEKEKYYNLLRELFEKNGAVEYENWQAKIREISREGNIIVRREAADMVEKILENKEKINLSFSRGQEPYPNSALLESDLEGLQIALAGGRGKVGKGSAVFTFGFKPANETKVSDLPKNKFPQFEGHKRIITKITEGNVPFENIKFILLRMPRSFFPENCLTEEETEKEAHHIQRIYIFENETRD